MVVFNNPGKSDRMSHFLTLAVAVPLVLLAGCSGQRTSNAAPPALTNGRSIFLTGRDAGGVQIHAMHRPLFPSCAACHRPSGAGGVQLTGGAVSADLRNAALINGQKHPYTLPLLERAISTGIDNEGKPLDPVMPRWQMSQRDLHDVATYVLTQLK